MTQKIIKVEGLSHTYVVSDLDEDGEECETYENIAGIVISEFHYLFNLYEKLGLENGMYVERSFLQFPP